MPTPDPKDPGYFPLTKVLPHAGLHVLPSVAGDMWEGAKTLAKRLTTPLSAPAMGSASEPISLGMIRALSDAALGTHLQTPGTTAGDAVRNEAASLGSAYGSWPALKRTLWNDPGRPVMDAQAIASLAEGGEGMLLKLPAGGARDAALAIARGAKGFNTVTNPVALGARGLTAAAGAGQRALRGVTTVTDGTGRLTPTAQAAVVKGFPNGQMGPADFEANPALLQRFQALAKTKGATAAAARQAVLEHAGVQTPTRAASTGTSAPSPVADEVNAQNEVAKKQVQQRVASIVGAPSQVGVPNGEPVVPGAPDWTSTGAALTGAKRTAFATKEALYKDAAQQPGTFGPTLLDNVKKRVGEITGTGAPVPPTDELAALSSYSKTPEAIRTLTSDDGHLAVLAKKGALTPAGLEQTRVNLNNLAESADGSDQHAVTALKGAFDQAVSDTLASGDYQGGDPNALANSYAQARAAHGAYQDTFAGQTANPTIKSALRAAGPEDDAFAAGNTVARGLFGNAPGRARLFNDLTGAVGPSGQSALFSDIRQTASQLPPDKLRDFMNGPVGVQVFNPSEAADLQAAAAGRSMLGESPTGKDVPTLGENIGTWGRTAVATGAGAGLTALATPMLGDLVKNPVVNGALDVGMGALSGTAARLLDSHITGGKLARQMAGAPDPGSFLNGPADFGRFAEQNIAPPARFAGLAAPKPSSPTGDIIGSETGALALPPRDFVMPDSDNWRPPPPAPAPTSQAAPAPAPAPTKGGDFVMPDDGWRPSPPVSDGNDMGAPVSRASGGKVDADIEPLVERLMRLAKHAKSATKKQTEPLLNVPDATITRALSVAQRAI